MWLFYEIEDIEDLDFSQETISPFVFTDYEQIITFATEKYKAHTLHEDYYARSSNIYIPDNYTLDNISDNEPYSIYIANISDRIFSGRVVKLRYFT